MVRLSRRHVDVAAAAAVSTSLGLVGIGVDRVNQATEVSLLRAVAHRSTVLTAVLYGEELLRVEVV